MHTGSDASARTIVPTLRYRDVAAAIAWLCCAFGFGKHLVVNAADGSIQYAELTFGDGMIMVGPVEDSDIGRLMTQPEQAGGAETQICYLFVEDAATHCAKARAAGAEIVLDIEDEGSGRGYSCRDPEGHIWNFGTYNPWRRQPETTHRGGFSRIVDVALRRLALGIGFLAMTFAAAVVVAWGLAMADPHAVSASSPPSAGERPQPKTQQVSVREVAERELGEMREQLRKERSAREGAERAAREAGEQLAKRERDPASLQAQEQVARERVAVEGAQRIIRETREQLALVERAAEEIRERLDSERASRLEAERAGKEAREQLAKEHAGREAAERASRELREQVAREHTAARALHRRPAAPSSSPFVWQ